VGCVWNTVGSLVEYVDRYSIPSFPPHLCRFVLIRFGTGAEHSVEQPPNCQLLSLSPAQMAELVPSARSSLSRLVSDHSHSTVVRSSAAQDCHNDCRV
jgi:hypothetical protein